MERWILLLSPPGTGANSNILAAAIQPDGKIIIVGQFDLYNGVARNRIARLNTDGTLDTSFNPGTGLNNSVFAVVIQPDGKILAGGDFTTYNGVTRNRLVRINTDGTLDTTFDPSLSAPSVALSGPNGTVNTIALQSDGQILIGGSFNRYNNALGKNRITRLNPDGSNDGTFLGSASNAVYTIILQPDGKMIIAGAFTGAGRNGIARLNTDGTLDTSFNSGTGFNNTAFPMVLQPDGKVIVGGNFTGYNGVAQNRLVRLNTDGTLDTTFDPGSGFNAYIRALALQPDGKVVVGGTFVTANGLSANRIIRLNTDGTRDTSFNIGTGFNQVVEDLHILDDTNIIATGGFTGYKGISRNRIARLGWNTDITITAPTKLSNSSITDTTITLSNSNGIAPADVVLHPHTTASTSNLNCTQITPQQVDCTISIDSTGNLALTTATLGGYALEANYIIDMVDPQVPTVSVDVLSIDQNNPTLTFSALDNIAVDYFEIDYFDTNGNPQTLSPITSPATLALDPTALLTPPFYHEITVRVFDTAGNSSENNIRFVPLVTFTSPTVISNTVINDTTFTVTTPSGNDISAISLSPSTTNAVLGTCTDINGGTTAPFAQPVTCTLSNIDTSGTITVHATDAINGAVGQNNQSFIIETNLPTITVSAPTKSNNTIITNTTITTQDDTAIDASDVIITAINTTGSFSISNSACTQTNASRVDCTFQVDANTGTGDIQIQATDVAGNISTTTETGYTIDVTPPITPAQAPDLSSSSDTGFSSTDNQTNQDTPTFEVLCTENDSEIELFIDGSSVETYTCTSLGFANITLASALADGDYDVTYTETDSFGNESGVSPVLTITLDTVIANTTINTPTNGSPVSGTGEPSTSVTLTTPSGSTCTTTTDGGGNYDCVLAPTPLDGENITATMTDVFGNTSNPTIIGGIDMTAPTTPLINPIVLPVTLIAGTGENGTTITLAGVACDNAPVIVAGGMWECVNPQPAPTAGQTITATATDTAGNISIGSYKIPSSSRSVSSIMFTCKDKKASNYSNFGQHKSSLCKYETISDSPAPHEETPGLCMQHQIITQNLRAPSRNGVYNAYTKAVVTEINKLQEHLNRLGFNSGPVDGIAGPLTDGAIKRMQTFLGTKPDGFVGPITRGLLNESCGSGGLKTM
jgi:uncharacterized delta-60 repeat protein